MSQQKKQGRPKSEEKSRQILIAASQLFLEEGFAKTSMDNVAKASGVSKQTVYSHFENKDVLFQAAISSKCRSYQLDTDELCELPLTSASFEECLIKIGVQFVRLIQDPQTIGIFRVIIAEAVNNPHVASLFYQAGPQASLDALGQIIFKLSENPKTGQNDLTKARANQLAVDYCALLKGEFHTLLLCGLHSPMTDAQTYQYAKQAAEKISVLFTHFTHQESR